MLTVDLTTWTREDFANAQDKVLSGLAADLAEPTIGLDGLAGLLESVKGATFATFDLETNPKLLKKHRETGEPCPWPYLVKRSRVNVCLGFFYENSVNRQRVREDLPPDFETLGLASHYRHVGGALIEHVHSGKRYVFAKLERIDASRWTDHAGNPIDPDSDFVAGYLPKSRPDSGRQGVADAVDVRTYSLASIRSVTMNGQPARRV